jgi:hypothetical protein
MPLLVRYRSPDRNALLLDESFLPDPGLHLHQGAERLQSLHGLRARGPELQRLARIGPPAASVRVEASPNTLFFGSAVQIGLLEYARSGLFGEASTRTLAAGGLAPVSEKVAAVLADFVVVDMFALSPPAGRGECARIAA